MKIPVSDDHDYVKRNRWILSNADGNKVFVKKFMLLLPPAEADRTENRIELAVEHVGGNGECITEKEAELFHSQ